MKGLKLTSLACFVLLLFVVVIVLAKTTLWRMNMKAKTIIVLLLIAGFAAAGAFASGQNEEESRPIRPEWRHPRMDPEWNAPELSDEMISVTGQLYFENRIHPELKSGNREYELLVPRFYAYELDLQEGQTVTIEGYTVTDMPCCEEAEEDDVHIWVSKAIIDGEEYDLQRLGPRMGMRGFSRDRRSWGPGRQAPRQYN
jgi:hypothetical protein